MLSQFDGMSAAAKRWSPAWYAHKHNVSLEEAKLFISKKKMENKGNLESFIQKYGEEEGTKKFRQKQERSVSRTFQNFLSKNPQATYEDFVLFNRKSSRRCSEFWQTRLNCSLEDSQKHAKQFQKETSGTNRNIYKKKGYSDNQIDMILQEINQKKDAMSINGIRQKHKHLSEEQVQELYAFRCKQKDNKSKEFFAKKHPEANTQEIDKLYFEHRLKLLNITKQQFDRIVKTTMLENTSSDLLLKSMDNLKKQYKWLVNFYTSKNDLSKLENIEKRGYTGKYELDHIYTISDGFYNKTPPEIVGSIVNLRVIPTQDNRKKHKKSDMTLNQLMDLYNKQLKEEK